MRIVTRPDFDGIVCAVLLSDVENISEPIKWVEPNDMHRGAVKIKNNDIIANLAYHSDCSLWFDHHPSNQIEGPFNGLFNNAPSAARNVFEFYKTRFSRDYSELVAETDRIDSARLVPEEVINPAVNPYVLLSMTISGMSKTEENYWNKLVRLLRHSSINEVHQDTDVREKVVNLLGENEKYKKYLTDFTRQEKHVSITDFLGFEIVPSGNRFLVFTLFPESTVNMKVRFKNKKKDQVILSIGHNIFNRKCKVNIGNLVKNFGGGGHFGAGSCCVEFKKFQESLADIVDILLKNKT